jgi:hypothetical protein
MINGGVEDEEGYLFFPLARLKSLFAHGIRTGQIHVAYETYLCDATISALAESMGKVKFRLLQDPFGKCLEGLLARAI